MPPKFLVIGPRCSGRSSVCREIAKEYGVVHLSATSVLKTDLGESAKKAKIYMERGQLVPDRLMIDIIFNRLNQPDSTESGWVLEGFPKTAAQAKSFSEMGMQFDATIQLECPEDVLIERVLNRRIDPVTGREYNLRFAPPREDEVRFRLVHRSDDTEQKVKEYLIGYNENLATIMDKFTNIYTINANRTPSLVWYELKQKMDRLVKYLVVFVLGGPGSGKGTQCAKIKDKFGYTHLSAGDLLREERNSGSELANMINEYIVQGKIVPAEVTINLLSKAMNASGNKKFLIDGFPRNMENMEAWYRIMDKTSLVDFVLFFDCPEDVMQERLLERGKTSGRNDDNVATIIKRFQTFQTESMPVMKSFMRLGKVRMISAVPPPNVVFRHVSRIFEGLNLVPPYQRTLGIVKPDAVGSGFTPAILEAVANANLAIVATKYVLMTEEVVGALFPDLYSIGGTAFNAVRDFMTEGPSVVLILEGTDAVTRWKALIGPPNPQDAKQTEPECLRAFYGTTPVRNALHASENEKIAIREITYFMDPNSAGAAAEIERMPLPEDDDNPVGIPVEHTLSMIKPCSSETSYEDIASIFCAHGFEIVSELKVKLTDEQCSVFYGEHRGKPFFERLKAFMTSGPIVAFKLKRHGAIKGLRHLMGFTNSEKARLERPDSIRALYGTDGTMNAVHGSDSVQSSNRELAFFFTIGGSGTRVVTRSAYSAEPASNGQMNGLSSSRSADKLGAKAEDNVAKVARARRGKLTATMSNTKRGEMALFLEDTIDPILRGMVERILVKKPKDVIAFAIQDLQELQRLSLGSGNGTAKGKLEPLMNVKSSPAMSPATASMASLTFGSNQGPLQTATVASVVKDRRASRRESWGRRDSIDVATVLRRELHILHFNDVYEYEEDVKHNFGGAARFTAQVKEFVEAENPIIINSGDVLSPSITSNITNGAHMINIMNKIGVHFGCLGNHDFDFGMDVLTKQLATSNAKWICTNLVHPVTRKPVAGCEKDTIINWNGVNLGLLGLCEDWLSLCPKVKSSEIMYLDIYEAAKTGFADLIKRGAEVVIAITHCRNAIDMELSRRVPEIDLILGGHDHEYLAWKEDGGTFGVKSGCDFRDMTKIRISLKPGYPRPKVHWPCIRVSVPMSLPEDPEVKEIVSYYKEHVYAKMKSAVAYCTELLDGRGATVRTTESNMGNLISDIMKAYHKTDVAILNGGFIRSDSTLDAGFISMTDVAKFFPFPDVLTYLEITGLELLYCLENSVSRAPAMDGRFGHLSGIRMTYDVTAVQQQRVRSVTVNDAPLDPERTYTISVNGFMGGGNEGYKVLKDKEWKLQEEFCPAFFNVLVNQLKLSRRPNFLEEEPAPDMFDSISPKVEGRVTVVDASSSANIYTELGLPFNKEHF